MTRIIKFRAWDYECKKMLNSVDLNPRICEAIYGWDKDDSKTSLEVMQYTGLKDKNDKEIYEGDIIEFNAIGSTEVTTGQVEYNNDGFYVNVISGKLYRLWADIFSKPKVVGNIYENNELVK